MKGLRTMYSQRRWMHGRIPQRLARLWCALNGHKWSEWKYDWPDFEFAADPELANFTEFGPSQTEELLWLRFCHRDCGGIQHCTGPLKQREELPL